MQSGGRVLRVVLDTNVFVSRTISRSGTSAKVFDAWRAMEYWLLVSPAIIREIEATLSSSHIRRKYPVTDQEIADLVDLLSHDALVIEGEMDLTGVVPEDDSDNMFLTCAIQGDADLIVTGDRHLLNLRVYEGIRIVSVREFCDLLHLE